MRKGLMMVRIDGGCYQSECNGIRTSEVLQCRVLGLD
jgi:hypothetical protein